MNVEQNLSLFQELLCCGNNIYTWCYDNQGALLHSNCPHESFLMPPFLSSTVKRGHYRLAEITDNRRQWVLLSD